MVRPSLSNGVIILRTLIKKVLGESNGVAGADLEDRMREDNASGTGLLGGSVPKGKKQLKFRIPGRGASWEESLESGLSGRSVLVAMVELFPYGKQK